MNTVPEFTKKYLWDVDSTTLSETKHARFIIERLLEYGDFDSLDWLKKTYSRDQLVNVLKTSNRLSAKSGNFYALLFRVPKEECLCLQKPYQEKQNRF